jgi:hypothetical protein
MLPYNVYLFLHFVDLSVCEIANCRKLTIIHSPLSYTFRVMVFDATYNNISVISFYKIKYNNVIQNDKSYLVSIFSAELFLFSRPGLHL